jgi:hypothetical protein
MLARFVTAAKDSGIAHALLIDSSMPEMPLALCAHVAISHGAS